MDENWGSPHIDTGISVVTLLIDRHHDKEQGGVFSVVDESFLALIFLLLTALASGDCLLPIPVLWCDLPSQFGPGSPKSWKEFSRAGECCIMLSDLNFPWLNVLTRCDSRWEWSW